MAEEKKIHYNQPQIRCLLVNPKTLYAVMGRGTGKSTGIIAPRMANCFINMPFSNNGLVARTFKQIKSRTLPSTINGWRKLGYKQDVHFVIGKKADKKLHFPDPDESPDDWEHVIHWFTGAIGSLSSQDRKNDSNGLNLQSLHNDESKLLDHEDLTDSIIPTLRGLPQYKDLVEYRSQTYTTDMPTTPEAKWILDAEEQNEPDVVELILQFQIQIQLRRQKIAESNSESSRTRLQYEINSLERKIHYLRVGDRDKKIEPLSYYTEASSFENIDMLTPEYIELMRRTLPDFVFETSILNRKPKGLEHGQRFYPQLSKKNFYTDFDYTYFDQFPVDIPEDKDTCLGDLDCNPQAPLEIVIDWGGKINSMLICQEDLARNRFNVLKENFALQPEIIHDLIEKYDKYYGPHGEKVVYVHYDRNGNAMVANSKETYAELVQRLLYEKGWNVYLMSEDENPGHREKFEFVNIMLSGNEKSLPELWINEEQCPNLKIAMYNTPIKIVNGELKKDKGSERSNVIPQEQATHITDCLDIITYKKYRKNIDGNINRFMGMMT